MQINLNRIKAERVAKGYTQEYMANKLGFKSKSAYSNREKGIVALSINDFLRILSILDMDNEIDRFLH